MFALTPEQEGHWALLPAIHRSIERLEGDLRFALRDIDRRLNIMSQALDDVLDKVSTTADQVIELLHTDQSSLTALQSSVDALKAAEGDDSAEVLKAQAVLDKLTAAVTPTAAPVEEVTPTEATDQTTAGNASMEATTVNPPGGSEPAA